MAANNIRRRVKEVETLADQTKVLADSNKVVNDQQTNDISVNQVNIATESGRNDNQDVTIADINGRVKAIEDAETEDISLSNQLIEVVAVRDIGSTGDGTIGDNIPEGDPQYVVIERNTSKDSLPALQLKINEKPGAADRTQTFPVYVIIAGAIQNVTNLEFANNSRPRFKYKKAPVTYPLEGGGNLQIEKAYIHEADSTESVRLDNLEFKTAHMANTNNNVGVEETTFTGTVKAAITNVTGQLISPETTALRIDTDTNTNKLGNLKVGDLQDHVPLTPAISGHVTIVSAGGDAITSAKIDGIDPEGTSANALPADEGAIITAERVIV
jgi:hypothetical protein